MGCAKCGGSLVDKDDAGMPFGECSSCGGMWFDSIALEAVFAKQQPSRFVGGVEDLMSLPESSPSSLKCARCHADLMVTTKLGVTVEWCRSCKGIHLDSGELEKIASFRKRRLFELRKDTAAAAASYTGGIAQLLIEEIFNVRFRVDRS